MIRSRKFDVDIVVSASSKSKSMIGWDIVMALSWQSRESAPSSSSDDPTRFGRHRWKMRVGVVIQQLRRFGSHIRPMADIFMTRRSRKFDIACCWLGSLQSHGTWKVDVDVRGKTIHR